MQSTRGLRPLFLLFAIASSATTIALPAQDPQGGGTFGNRVLKETTFAGWTSPVAYPPLVNFGGGLTTFSVTNTCGNGAPGMRVTCAPPAGATAGRVLLSAATWNPATDCTDCPVTDVCFQVDHINGVTAVPGQLVWPAIVQGTTLFVASPLPAFSGVWATLAFPAAPATSFLDVTGANALGLTLGSLNPDFSCSGTPLSFGLVVTVSSAVATTRTHCYDNFEVVLKCPASFTTFCTGCPNCGVFPPAIGYTGGLPTVPNPTFKITESGACPSVPTFLILGMSDSTSGMGALPLNLAFLGFPGCNLCVSPDAIVGAFTTGFGTAFVPLPIPNDEYLIGAKFYAQWIDFGPPPIGMSNAAKIVIGS